MYSNVMSSRIAMSFNLRKTTNNKGTCRGERNQQRNLQRLSPLQSDDHNQLEKPRSSLIFAKELSTFQCSIEGDVEVIIKAILAGVTMNLKYGHVIHDVLVLANGFRCCKFSHVKHIGNSVAHFLARKAISSNELQV